MFLTMSHIDVACHVGVHNSAPKATRAIPTLMKGPQGKMLGEAVGQLKNMVGADRAAAFRNFAEQIKTASSGSWSAAESAIANGGHAFVGSLGRVLAFDSRGRMFVGDITNAAAFQFQKGGALKVTFDALKPIK